MLCQSKSSDVSNEDNPCSGVATTIGGAIHFVLGFSGDEAIGFVWRNRRAGYGWGNVPQGELMESVDWVGINVMEAS